MFQILNLTSEKGSFLLNKQLSAMGKPACKNSTVICKHQLWEGKGSQNGKREKKVREPSIGAGDVEEKMSQNMGYT